jgi:hypothetical protein
MTRLFTVLAVVSLSGCAAPAFLGNTGRSTPKGDFRVGLGTSYQVNTQAAVIVKDGRDAARTLAERTTACPGGAGDCWTVADVEPVVDAAFRFAVVAPLSTSTALSGRYGIGKGFDAGVRWGTGGYGADLGYQAFGPRDPLAPGLAGTFLAGVGKRSMGTLGDVIEGVLHGEASLTDWSAAFVLGRQWGTWAHTFAAARYTLTEWTLTVVPDLPVIYDAGEVQRELLGTDPDGIVHTTGAALGAAVGWKKVYVGGELDFLVTAGSATVLGRERDLGSFGVMPALYVYGQF